MVSHGLPSCVFIGHGKQYSMNRISADSENRANLPNPNFAVFGVYQVGDSAYPVERLKNTGRVARVTLLHVTKPLARNRAVTVRCPTRRATWLDLAPLYRVLWDALSHSAITYKGNRLEQLNISSEASPHHLTSPPLETKGA